MNRDRLLWFVAGVAAVAVALGVGELMAGLLGGSSIIVAVGALVISLQPPGGKDLMVELFGTNDKLALEIMIGVGGMLVGGLLGVIAQRDMRGAVIAYLAVALFGFWLILQDPLAGPISAAISVLPAALAGLFTLGWLGRLIERTASAPPADEPAAAVPPPAAPWTAPPIARRSFLAIGAVFVAAGSFLGVIGRFLGSQVSTVGPPIAIPSAGETLPPAPDAADFDIAGLSPIVVPNEDFYRIDTRLTVPNLDSATWSLRVHGMVEGEVTLSYSDLLAMPLYERHVTIACVSNEVGGHLVGNAKWKGVALVSVLDRAGIRPGATQFVGRSFDGWTCGFPTEHLSGAGSEAMIAVEMNGEPLPASHGFPARLIVPGLYGYVSATKWLTEIEMTTLEAFDAYWVPLGWAKQAPILTQSRIDLPRNGASVAAGAVTVAGVAWAPTRGISRVEVQLDDGPWQEAELSQPLSDYAWVQWRAALDVPAGSHMLSVRATDGTGETQTAERTRPAPDGARGYHQIGIATA
jgi:DMSO/TMAO reductase YedYZ molybdopterin-dependent catalytic subunit